MAGILLVSFPMATATRLSSFFRDLGHSVAIEPAQFPRPEALCNFDLVILDVTKNHVDLWQRLATAERYRIEHGPRPMILCRSLIYRGPRFELDIEQKGARLIYAH
jgi:hypothetical protein